MDDDTAPSVCFAPIVRPDIRILVLGSLPGKQSLALGQYYGHPRNHFWPVIGGLIGVDLVSLPYAERLQTLLNNGIGLWDVVARAHRPGSLDQHMKDIEANSLYAFISALPNLRAIAFNGATASRIGRRQLISHTDSMPFPALMDMPSTSPANTMRLSEKTKRWEALLPFIHRQS